MKIYSEQINQFPKKYGNFIAQPLNNKSNILCVNDDSVNIQSINRLTKCNYKWFQDNFRSNLFTLPLNKCYNNAILKILTLIGICEFSIFAYADRENASVSNSSELTNQEGKGVSGVVNTVSVYLHKTQSYLETAITFIMAQIDCTRRVKSGMCCCKPRSASKREEDELRAQFELMQRQMNMQQQQMCRAMMGESLSDSDEDEEDDEDEDEDEEDDEEEDEDDEEEEEEEEKKKNNKRKNNEQEEKKKHENDEKRKHEDNKKQKESVNMHNKGKNDSKNDNIHIGYHSST
ncbi:hypothetical protein POVCU1_062400 [Plasmodium ovale curtisi]|uniref:Uncharacterized protein n=1 Tax=Plasmodium ovale curtisi TaxID=864141 RepID=A0A1A8X950_PLAOA|nr:hypothetical protein POVCU1_062400 [Plasmodium ovale curtisi]